jgi:Fur family transcriptional regulator, ferric uptake regulator
MRKKEYFRGAGAASKRSPYVTVSHRTPPLAAASVDSAVALLRARNLRVSAARRLVLEALFAADKPLTAEEIAAGLEGWLPSSDLASVYRNLDTLEEIGLVRHFHLGHGPGLYARASAGRHEYLLCDACGAVLAVPPERLDAVRDLIRSDFGYEARFTHFPIAGLCPDCAAEPA